jgi:glycosyltransferase involved in cell wall biosynthesis
MKILIVISAYPPLGYTGHSERCRQVVGGLVRRGHQLQVLTSNHRLPPLGLQGEQGIFRELVRYPGGAGGDSAAASFSAIREVEMVNAGALAYRIERFQPDVVYVWDMRELSRSLVFQIQQRGIPVVYDLHSEWLFPETFCADPWYRWWHANPSKRSLLYRSLVENGIKMGRALKTLPVAGPYEVDLASSYVVSEWLRERLVGSGHPQAADLPVIYPGIEQQGLTQKTSFQCRRKFIWAGRLDSDRGCDLVIEAVKHLNARGEPVSVDLFTLGSPRLRKAQRAQIDESGLAEQIRMRGIRPGQLVGHYGDYDALLYTSRVGEPFSITVLEAMLSKLPCIAADVGGIREWLVDGVNAVLFEADNVDSLVDAMLRFGKLQDGGRQLAEHDFSKFRETLSEAHFCQRIEAVLLASIDKKSGI